VVELGGFRDAFIVTGHRAPVATTSSRVVQFGNAVSDQDQAIERYDDLYCSTLARCAFDG
jgi:hypothetical protein